MSPEKNRGSGHYTPETTGHSCQYLLICAEEKKEKKKAADRTIFSVMACVLTCVSEDGWYNHESLEENLKTNE